MIVAIDGPAGVGKSTLAKNMAQRFNLFNLNSGNFYRAATYLLIEQEEQGKVLEKDEILKMVKNASMVIQDERFLVNGEAVEEQLHSDKIDLKASRLSALPELRDIINEKIQEATHGLNVVAEGRDMTSVVFPHAQVKIFLDASPMARAERRFKQGTSELSLQDIALQIEQRDAIDRNKEKGALKIVEDANYLDTSALTLDQVCEKVSRIIYKIENPGE
ncbi:MAG: (d)CMP kinase [Spirochaetaceae bacterium]|jgi:cytidylate kinase|nr:(d)CMP kinase [Spirochaetaceae bacterium]